MPEKGVHAVLKVDIYNHFMPQVYWDKMMEIAPQYENLGKRVRNIRMLTDLDFRFEVMDRQDEYVQILTVNAPPPEALTGPDRSPELAIAANDGLADLCAKYPDRFVGFGATMPMNNIDAALDEIDRAVDDLGALGAEIYTNVAGRPLDDPEFEPFFARMHERDLPIWVHPVRGDEMADYASEEKSRYELWWAFGWPYETSAFMARMVLSGLMERYPGLKMITHHMGGMVPYFEGRVGAGLDQLGKRTSDEDYSGVLAGLSKPHLEYFKDFYADTAVFGAVGATKCGLEFFGADHVVFASDAPFDPVPGQYIAETIKIIDELDITDEDRAKIYYKNAERLTGRSFS